MNRYNIYPTLLDKFHDYLYPERLFDYGKTEADIEQELLNAINRVPFESEPADRGTAFNELVDAVMCGAIKVGAGIVQYPFTSRAGVQYSFEFPCDIVRELAEYFSGGVSQVRCDGEIRTPSGIVTLYGYADEVLRDTVYDIKTTSNYQFPKYTHGYQKHVYPLCLVQKGNGISMFEYTVTDFRNTYREAYKFNYEKSERLLSEVLDRFIMWLEINRNKITDNKIFNL
jgi:hypothetical protein